MIMQICIECIKSPLLHSCFEGIARNATCSSTDSVNLSCLLDATLSSCMISKNLNQQNSLDALILVTAYLISMIETNAA
jgi:hypothetical protein